MSKLALTGPTIDAESLKAYRARWDLVAERISAERLNTSMELRWQQLNALFGLAVGLGLYERMRDRDVSDVRRRWAKLRAGYQ